MTKSPCLSVAIIARDAAGPLAETLASIRGAADEIVVLDTGSADRTAAVAKEVGAFVHAFPWDGDFSAARNECWSHVNGAWVLWLDAGETLLPEDAQSLKEFVAHEANLSTSYMLLVAAPAGERDLSGEQVGRVRLTPNHPDLCFTGRVRESLAPALAEIGFSVEGLPFRIRRDARELDETRRLARARRNIQLAIREMNEVGPLPRLLNCLAEAHQTLGEAAKAEGYYRGALKGEAQLAERLEAYYGLLVALEGRVDSRAAQVAVCLEGLEEFPLDAHLLCAMGGYLQSSGHADLAMRSLETAWRHGQVHPEVWHLGDIREIAAVSLSRCQELAGLMGEAAITIEEALTEHAASARLHRRREELRSAAATKLRNAS